MTQHSPRISALKSRVQTLEDERQQTQRALDALYRIGLACRGQNDPQALLATIYRELQTVWDFDACYIALCDQFQTTHYRLAMLVDEGVMEWSEHDPVGLITGYMLQHRQPLLFADLVTERTRIGLPEVTIFGSDKLSRGWMGVPLLFGHNALGVISLQSYSVGVFKDADVELLSRLANSMAVALENATLSHRQAELTRSLAEQVELRNADLFVISDIAAMLTQQQPLPAMFALALDFMLDVVQFDGGAVCSVQGSEWTTIAQRGLDENEFPASFEGQASLLVGLRREQMPTVLDPTKTDEWAALPSLPSLATVMLVPLRRSDVVIGMLLVGNRAARTFKLEEVELLQVVGNQLALALEHGYILEQQQRQIAELEALSHISYAASRSLDAATLLQQLYTAIRAFLALDVFFMAIYDPERGVLTDSIAIADGQPARYIMEEAVPLPGSFTAWIIEHRQTLFLRHVSQDLPHHPTIVRTTIGTPSETWLGVPMLDSRERPLGLISLQSYQPNAFTERDRIFLQAVASQVSLHVLNVRLFGQRERQLAELNALQRISELIGSTLDIGPMIESIDEVLTTFLRLDAFFVALYNAETNLLEGLYVLEYGVLQPHDAMIGQPLPPRTPTSWVIEHGIPLRFNDIDADIAQLPELTTLRLSQNDARSWLGVPLVGRDGRSLGAITVQSYTPNVFSSRDEQFMLQVARQLTLAIQNARLFAQRERQLAELDARQRITELVSSTLDLRQMLRSIDVVLRSFLHADAFQVVIYDPDRDRVEIAVVLEQGQDVSTQTEGRPLFIGTFVGWTLHHAEPLRLANIYTEWHNYPDLNEPTQPPAEQAKPAWLSVPLLQQSGRPLGVLAVRSFREGAFGAGDQRFLLNVGRQLALSVRNARLFAAEQTAHRTADTLREIARVLNTSFNPDEVLMLILRELKKVVNYDSASVMLPGTNGLRIVARQAADEDHDERWRELRFPIDSNSGAGRVMLNGRPIIINDTVGDGGWTASPMMQVVRSWVGVPLRSKNIVLGVLNINALQANNFTTDDADIALTFANGAATALEHARLYQESVTRVEQEMEIARRIQSNLFPRELPTVPNVTLAALCHPAKETGGDFYDVLELRPGHWGLIVGDASGKSIPAAMLMAVARSIARSEARNHEVPDVVMRQTNAWVARDVPPNTFVAMSYATLDTVQHTLALTNAGQLDPIVVHADGELEYLVTDGAHFPLGIMTDTRYEMGTFQLRHHDLLLFYTDGVVEAKRADGEIWGFERLEAVMRESAPLLAPPQLIAIIISAINAFVQNHPQHDDITLVALRIEPNEANG